MLFTRILLGLQALILTVLGLAYFIRPEQMAGLSGTLLMDASAVTHARAWYGCLPLGLAAFLLLSQLRLQLARAALDLLVLLYMALALGRVSGLWLDGGLGQTFNLYALLFEVVSAGLAFAALRKLDGA
ncbi:DUF4345 domain-containing protein [Pseudomonas sp. LFM046]|uniref:DUF4345 domain-containing protein n=1 Tax=Pseudomonas sp. LFM046 TaxID=1608357 RepID=UPI0005CFEABF|nr:DUF4345 domain-containing protein [Pseudomonas sp. LFM046]